MKKIRNLVFETNSSSTHSLTINNTGELDTIIPKDGIITLTGGDFGWEWKKYNDAITKANYCAVDVQHNEYKIEMLKAVIINQTRCKEVIIDLDTDSDIDHQSMGTTQEVFYNKEELRQFIFNKKSYLYTGNDNSESPHNFYKDEDTIYTYKLTFITNKKYELFFEKLPSEEELIKAIKSELYDVTFNELLNKWEEDGGWCSGTEFFVFNDVIDKNLIFVRDNIYVEYENLHERYDLLAIEHAKEENHFKLPYNLTKI